MSADVKDAAHAVDAATVMGLLPARPRLLALGEPTHGEDVLLEVRNDLFRQLIERERYQTITIESDCCNGGAPGRPSAPSWARGTPSWPPPSARSATTVWAPHPRTPSKGSCTRSR